MAAMHLLRRCLAAAVLLVCGSTLMSRADAQGLTTGPLATLQSELSTMSLHAPGNVGIMVEDLNTGLRSSSGSRTATSISIAR